MSSASYSKWTKLSLLVLGIMSLSLVSSVTQQAAPKCSDAENYLKSGALSLAEEAYKSALEANPDEECAISGLQQVALGRCGIAETKAAAGDISGAKSTLATVLESYPDMICAVDALRDLAPANCADGKRFLTSGALGLSEQVFNDVLKADPQDSCALGGLVDVAVARCKIAQTKAAAGDREGALATLSAVLESYPGMACAVNGLGELAPANCEDGELYLEAGALSLAEQAFKGALERDPEDSCALTGLAEIADGRCELAQVKVAAGDLEGAKATFSAILEAYPYSRCAIDGLGDIPNKFDEVVGLVEAGDYKTAWTKLSAAIGSNPADKELESLTRQSWARAEKLKEVWKEFLLPGLLFVVGIVIFALAAGWLRRINDLRLDIGDFELGMFKASPDPPNGQDPNKVLIAEFEEAIESFGSTAGLQQPHLIDAPISIPTLPVKLGSVPADLKGLWELITKLFPPKVLTIRGTLLADPTKGAGINIKLVSERGNELWASFSIWQNDVEPGVFYGSKPPAFNDYLELIEPAAIKAYWSIRQRKRRFWHISPTTLLRQTFGTNDSDSYIALRLGASLLEKDDLISAERILRKSLTHDHKNSVAWFNLAMVELRHAEDRIADAIHNQRAPDVDLEFARVLEHLQSVKRLTQNAPKNASRTLAFYNIGVVELYKHILTYGTANSRGNVASAKEYLEYAVEIAVSLSGKDPAAITAETIAMLKIAYGDALTLSDSSHPYPPNEVTSVQDAGFAAPWVLYNLACHASVMVQFGKENVQALDQALLRLRDVLAAQPAYVQYAMTDVSLKTLREKKSKEFEALIKEYTQKPSTKSPIRKAAMASLVGTESAKRLGTAGIDSPDELLRKASKAADRKSIASKTAINARRLLHWTLACEMLRVSGIELNEVVVADAAGVSSLSDLSTWDGRELELLQELKVANSKLKVLPTLPDRDTASWWVEQAKNIPSQVER